MNRAAAMILVLFLGGCTGLLAQGRQTVDQYTAVVIEKNQQLLVEVDIERKRLRRARCHGLNLTPNALSLAAANPQLGPAWIDELLENCPQFAAFLQELALRRAREAGVPLPE